MALSVTPQVAGTISAGDVPFILDNALGDYKFSGLSVSSNATTSTAVSISTGTAFLQGFQILEDGTGSLNVATSATQFIFAVITLNASNKPTSVAYVATTSETQSNAMRLAKAIVTTNLSSVEIDKWGPAMLPFNTIQFTNNQIGGVF